MTIDINLLEEASLYGLGLLEGEEKLLFEKQLRGSPELQKTVQEFSGVSALLAFGFGKSMRPPEALRQRILSQINSFGAESSAANSNAGIVVTGNDGRVIWVNEAFTRMCGYTLAELKGRKPGSMLQGSQTDPSDIACLREAVHKQETCTRSIVNYHKDGSPYKVNIRLMPLRDGNDEFQGFMAVEQLLENESVAA